MKKVDLVKLILVEDGNLLIGVHKQLKEDLSNWQLNKILGRMDKVAEVIAEVVREECENEKEGN